MSKNNHLQTNTESPDDIVIIMDYPSMNYRYISPAVMALGVTPEEVYTDPMLIRKLVDEEVRQAIITHFLGNSKHGPQYYEYNLTVPDGESRLFSSTLYLVNYSADEQIITAILRDITDQRQAEIELATVSSLFEDLYNRAPVGYHSLDPNGFLLRINDTEIAWLGYTREELIGQHFASKILTKASLKLYETVFPILKKNGFAKDLWEVIEEAIGINARKAEYKGIHLSQEMGLGIGQVKAKADAKWLVRALDNIIANAIKFSNKGDKVKIGCHKVARRVVLSVEDTGIGIPAAMLPNLFNKFAVPSRPGTAGELGSGLGLSIVKQIVDMQTGEISVKSQVGKGSIFEIKLPMAN